MTDVCKLREQWSRMPNDPTSAPEEVRGRSCGVPRERSTAGHGSTSASEEHT